MVQTHKYALIFHHVAALRIGGTNGGTNGAILTGVCMACKPLFREKSNDSATLAAKSVQN